MIKGRVLKPMALAVAMAMGREHHGGRDVRHDVRHHRGQHDEHCEVEHRRRALAYDRHKPARGQVAGPRCSARRPQADAAAMTARVFQSVVAHIRLTLMLRQSTTSTAPSMPITAMLSASSAVSTMQMMSTKRGQPGLDEAAAALFLRLGGRLGLRLLEVEVLELALIAEGGVVDDQQRDDAEAPAP